MTKKFSYELDLLTLPNAKMMPWATKVGGPAFPKKLLWTTPSLTVNKTDVRFDGTLVSWSQSTLSDLTTVKIEVSVNSGTEGYLNLYSGTTLEASIHEVFDTVNKTLTCTWSSSQDPGATLIMKLTWNESTEQITIKFTFNSNNYESTIGIESADIPQCLLNVLDEIDSYSPNITTKALQYETEYPFIVSAIGRGPVLPRATLWPEVLCAVGTGLSDFFTIACTAAYGGANVAILLA